MFSHGLAPFSFDPHKGARLSQQHLLPQTLRFGVNRVRCPKCGFGVPVRVGSLAPGYNAIPTKCSGPRCKGWFVAVIRYQVHPSPQFSFVGRAAVKHLSTEGFRRALTKFPMLTADDVNYMTTVISLWGVPWVDAEMEPAA